MAATIEMIEPGIFRRKDPKTGKLYAPLHIVYQHGLKSIQESAKTTDIRVARKLRAQRITEVAQGTAAVATITVGELLDALLTNYAENDLASLRTIRGHVHELRAALGTLKARDLKTAHLNALRARWAAITGPHAVTKATINKRCGTLRRALNLAHQAGDLPVVPFVPMYRKVKGIKGQYLPAGDHAALAEQLPDYVVTLLDFARLYGIRRGQLSRTRRAWLDRDRALIKWPDEECKNDDPHTLPLDDAGLAIIDRLLAEGARHPWCPFLFHGPHCKPGRTPNKTWGCVGDFKKAWATACAAAGMPVGRKQGGYIFHNTRNTAVTDMLASGRLSTAEAMAVSGHKTEAMIKHYNLGNIEALRERLQAARTEIERLRLMREA